MCSWWTSANLIRDDKEEAHVSVITQCKHAIHGVYRQTLTSPETLSLSRTFVSTPSHAPLSVAQDQVGGEATFPEFHKMMR